MHTAHQLQSQEGVSACCGYKHTNIGGRKKSQSAALYSTDKNTLCEMNELPTLEENTTGNILNVHEMWKVTLGASASVVHATISKSSHGCASNKFISTQTISHL